VTGPSTSKSLKTCCPICLLHTSTTMVSMVSSTFVPWPGLAQSFWTGSTEKSNHCTTRWYLQWTVEWHLHRDKLRFFRSVFYRFYCISILADFSISVFIFVNGFIIFPLTYITVSVSINGNHTGLECIVDRPVRPVITGCIVGNWRTMNCSWEPAYQDTGITTTQELAWRISWVFAVYLYTVDVL